MRPNQNTRDQSGRLYRTDACGTLWRISPARPWRGKSERRQVIKQRRLDRA